MKSIKLNNGKEFGGQSPVLIVAEIGLCHNGDSERAMDMIKQAVEAGADAVKFQKRDVDNLAISSVLDAEDLRFPGFGKTYREIRKHIEFDLDTYKRLKKYADDLGTAFFVSVFDIKSAEQMAELGMPVLKIASHCLSNKPLIEKLTEIKLPVLLSTGMAYLEEVDETVNTLLKAGVELGLYHCVSEYPHTYKTSNLKQIPFLKQRYGLPVGYSSHEQENYTAILSVAAGACSIEKHVTLNNSDEGFDHKMALTMPMLKNLSEEIRKAETAMGTGEKTVSEKEMETRRKYHSSVVSKTKIKAGEVITREMLTVKNPGTGIPAKEIDSIIGLKATIDIEADILLELSMLQKG